MLKSMPKQTLLLTLFMLAAPALAADDASFLVAGTLIDTLEGETVSDPVIEIKGDRIVSVTSGGDVPDGATIIDLGDTTS